MFNPEKIGKDIMIYPTKMIYLAGPITGLTHDEARYGWRREFAGLLPEHIHCNSPMRGKDMLKDFGVLTAGDDYPDNAMTTSQGITCRDFNDVRTCDAMIACFLESNGTLSGGTFMEYGFAHALQIPIIGIGPADDQNLHHLMAQRVLGWRVDDLVEAATIVTLLLTPGL
jgi:nucleoside 2-deoxyribosyltransferase